MIDRGIFRLIAITDSDDTDHTRVAWRAAEAAEGGATCIQLRLKNATGRELAHAARVVMAEISIPLIINDRADVAIAVGAAGCHLGADDVPATAIRRIAPTGFIIGCSVGSESELGSADGADYAGIGPIFATSTKVDAGNAIGLEGFRILASRLAIPALGIGGITAENAAAVMTAGACGIAVVSAIFGARDVRTSAHLLARAIES